MAKLRDLTFQTLAVKQLKKFIRDTYEDNLNMPRMMLQAPTGSGKTTIMSLCMDALTDYINDLSIYDKIAFVWISLGDGGLYSASKKKVELNVHKLNCMELADAVLKGSLATNDALFVNWDKINKKTNKYMNESAEYKTFRDLVKNTHKNVDIIMVIDESHINGHTDRAQEIINLVAPKAIIEMTATPRDFPYDRKHTIHKEDVISAGLIKKQVCINRLATENSIKGAIPYLLRAAEDRRKQLHSIYKDKGININPLVLIQIPDAEEGTEIKEKVIEELTKLGISQKIGNLGIWLSEEKDKEDIEDLESPKKYLIFKQAIAKGWDCPRAQILVKFRITNGDAFEIQTIGRILRMPEAIHYDIEDLNMAYIYTDDEEFITRAKQEADAIEYTDPINIKSEHKDFAQRLIIPCEKVKNYKNNTLDRKLFKEILYKQILDSREFGNFVLKDYARNENLLKTNGSTFNINISDAYVGKTGTKIISSAEFMDGAKEKSLPIEDFIIIEKDLNDIDRNFSKNIKSIFTDFDIRDIYFDFTEDYLDWNIEKSKKLFNINFDKIFKDIFLKAAKQYNEQQIKKQDVEEKPYTFTEPIHFNKNTNIEKKVFKNLYERYFVNGQIKGGTPTYIQSEPERNFENFLDKADRVIWWHKNQDNGAENFSIAYEDNKGCKRPHFPDYIILTKTKLYLIETKGGENKDIDKKTGFKSNAIQTYIRKHNDEINEKYGICLYGGIARQANGIWKLNISGSYSEDLSCSDWIPLEF